MSFIELLEEINVIIHYERFNEYQNDSNYAFETFALSHYMDLEGNLKIPHYSIENIPDWIMYIEQRALSTHNKVLRSRYNDLLWSYKKEFNNKQLIIGNVKDKCELAITDYISLADEDILKRTNDENLFRNLQTYLHRAWTLAKQIKSSHIKSLIQLMIDIENTFNDDGKIGLWGFSYRYLIKDTSFSLTPEQEDSIIQRIISRVNVLDSQDFNAIKYGVEMLLEYYKSDSLELEKYLDLLEKLAHAKSERPFENQHRFKNLITLCHKYNFKERKERAIIAYQYYGKDINKNLIKIEEKVEITQEMRDSVVSATSSEQPVTHFLKICYFHLFDKNAIKKRVESNKQEFVLQNLFQTVLTNEDGVTYKALITEEDELFHESKFDWQIQSPFLFISIEHFSNKHHLTPESLKDLLFDEILYKNLEVTLLTAIQAYFNRNFISMCYISVPLIENGLRQLLFQCDRSIYEENKHDGFENITLTRVISSLEEYLTEDLIFYLKFVLNEKAGLNIRNNLTHGLMGDSYIGERTALTVLHILMILKSLVGFDYLSLNEDN